MAGDASITELRAQVGRQLDPELVESFVDIVHSDEHEYTMIEDQLRMGSLAALRASSRP